MRSRPDALLSRRSAQAKRRAAAALESRALDADAFQTTACFWLSIVTLAGIGLNAAFGWWWADPAAALAMTAFIGREGLEAWRGEACGCASASQARPRASGSAPGACCLRPGEREPRDSFRLP